MIKPDSPCRDCERRVVGCHSTCEEFKAFEIENETYKELLRKGKDKYGKLIQKSGGKIWIR